MWKIAVVLESYHVFCIVKAIFIGYEKIIDGPVDAQCADISARKKDRIDHSYLRIVLFFFL